MLAYLLQMIACSGLLYAYYYFFLRNEKFHQYNRFYLLAIIPVSIVLPLFQWNLYFEVPAAANRLVQNMVSFGTLPEVVVSTGSSLHYPFWAICLLLMYAAVALLLMTRFGVALKQILQLRYHNEARKWNRQLLFETADSSAPFTFFNWIFWNRNIDETSPEGKKILRHEYYHASQKHTLDIVLAEIATAVFWINPFFHLLKREMKTVHEFLADRYASNRENKLAYAEMLVLQAIQTKQHQLVHPFFNHQLKRRIAMLTSTTKTSCSYIRQLMTLPLLILTCALMVISCQSGEEKSTANAPAEHPLPTSSGEPVTSLPETTALQQEEHIRAHKNTAPSSIDKVVTTDTRRPVIFTKVEVDARYKGNWRSFLEKNLDGQVAVDNGAQAGTYTTIIQFVVDTDGSISDIKGLTNVGYGLEQEAIRVIKQSGKWEPAKMYGQPVKAYRKQPITFQINDA